MRRPAKTFGCPVELALDVLGGKWKPVILARLKDQQLRYADLRRLIPALSDKVLTARLRDLVADGLVIHDATLRHYRLSERGQSLRPVFQALYDWGQEAAPNLKVTIAPQP